jgi:hypothetical protein
MAMLSVAPKTVARERHGKLCFHKQLDKCFPATANTHAIIEELLDAVSLCGSCCVNY